MRDGRHERIHDARKAAHLVHIDRNQRVRRVPCDRRTERLEIHRVLPRPRDAHELDHVAQLAPTIVHAAHDRRRPPQLACRIVMRCNDQ